MPQDQKQMLQAVLSRKSRGAYGLGVAADYVAAINSCLSDGICAAKWGKVATPEQWANCLKEAGSTLIWRDDRMGVNQGTALWSKLAATSLYGEGCKETGILVASEGDIAPLTCMEFDAIITSNRKDRDGDIMEPLGAILDQRMPLLWQHLPLHPIGKFLRQIGRDAQHVSGKFAIIDSELGRDAAQLVAFGGLRISHGFRPIKYEPLKRSKAGADDPNNPEYGFLVERYEVMETSLVSVPSNVDAIITASSRNKLHSPLIGGWAKGIADGRPAMVVCGWDGAAAAMPRRAKSNLVESNARGLADLAFRNKPQVKFVKPPACGCNEGCSCKKKDACDCEPHFHAPKSSEDPIRWNKSTSALFDIAETVEPSTILYDWVSEYIGCEIKHISELSVFIPAARMGSFLTGLEEATKHYHLEDARNLSHDGAESPPQYDTIQLTSTKSGDFIVKAMKFYKADKRTKGGLWVKGGPGGEQADRFVIRLDPIWQGIEITFYDDLRIADSPSKQVMHAAAKWARENNFLKGEAFTLSGEFLERTAEGWDDVFLEPKNKIAVKRVIDQFNEKQGNFANRGMILTGPPGTGKTMSSRIIRNQAKGSFIWVSSRDFHYSGGTGGMMEAFDLAKELAPAIICFEDCDNWLHPTNIDLMKTEMDGMKRDGGVLTILTTNYPERLPNALIDRPGRFHDVLKFGLPDATARGEMLRKWLPGLEDATVNQLVAKTEGYSGAHVYELAFFAKTLKEADGLELASACESAVAKIEEQRDLITAIQLEGGGYDVPLHVGRRRSAAGLKPKAIKLKNGTVTSLQTTSVSLKALLDDGASGGEHVAPSVFDDKPKNPPKDGPKMCKGSPGCGNPVIAGTDYCITHAPAEGPNSVGREIEAVEKRIADLHLKCGGPGSGVPGPCPGGGSSDTAWGHSNAAMESSMVARRQGQTPAPPEAHAAAAQHNQTAAAAHRDAQKVHEDHAAAAKRDGKPGVAEEKPKEPVRQMSNTGNPSADAASNQAWNHTVNNLESRDPKTHDEAGRSHAQAARIHLLAAAQQNRQAREKLDAGDTAGAQGHVDRANRHIEESGRHHDIRDSHHSIAGTLRDGKAVDDYAGYLKKMVATSKAVGITSTSIEGNVIVSIDIGSKCPYDMGPSRMPGRSMPHFPGSREETQEELSESAETYLRYLGVEDADAGTVFVVATFDDHGLIAVSPWSDPDDLEYYRVSWEIRDGEPTWFGPAQEVEVSMTVQEATKAAMAASRKGFEAMHENMQRLGKAYDLVHKVKMHKGTDAMHHSPLEKAKGSIKSVQNTFISDPTLYPNEVGSGAPAAPSPGGAPSSTGKGVDDLEKVDGAKPGGSAVAAKKSIKEAMDGLQAVHDHAEKPVHDDCKGHLKEAMGHCKAFMDSDAAANPATEGAQPGMEDGKPNPGTGKASLVDQHLTKALGLMMGGARPSASILESVMETLAEKKVEIEEAMTEELLGVE